jgi:hypothetical protein
LSRRRSLCAALRSIGPGDRSVKVRDHHRSAIVPVTVNLLNADGTQRHVNGNPLIVSAHALVRPVLNSPVFSTTTYASSTTPTQLSDADQRASFYNLTSPSWLTLLRPRVLPAQTIGILAGSYVFALNPDGTCCDFVLILCQ